MQYVAIVLWENHTNKGIGISFDSKETAQNLHFTQFSVGCMYISCKYVQGEQPEGNALLRNLNSTKETVQKYSGTSLGTKLFVVSCSYFRETNI